MTRTLQIARSAARRRFARRLVSVGGAAFLAASAISLLGVGVDRLVGPGLAWWHWVAWPAAGALAGSLAIAIVRRGSLLDAASEVDQELGLADRLGSGLVFELRGEGDDPFVRLALDDAERVATGAKVGRAIPVRFGRSWAVWPVLLAGSAAIGLFVEPQHLLGRDAQRSVIAREDPAVVRAAEEIERLRDQIAEPDSDPGVVAPGNDQQPASADLGPSRDEILDELSRQLLDGEKSPDEAIAEAAAVADEEARRAERSAEDLEAAGAEFDRVVNSLSPGGAEGGPSESAALREKLSEGDLSGAAQDLSDLEERLDSMEPAERERLSEELQRMARELDQLAELERQQIEEQAERERRDLLEQGLSEEDARSLEQSTDESELQRELEERGVDPEVAERLAREQAQRNREREARERAAEQTEQLRDAIDPASAPPEEQPSADEQERPGSDQTGEQTGSEQTGEQEQGEQQSGEQGTEPSPEGQASSDPGTEQPGEEQQPGAGEQQPDPSAPPEEGAEPGEQGAEGQQPDPQGTEQSQQPSPDGVGEQPEQGQEGSAPGEGEQQQQPQQSPDPSAPPAGAPDPTGAAPEGQQGEGEASEQGEEGAGEEPGAQGGGAQEQQQDGAPSGSGQSPDPEQQPDAPQGQGAGAPPPDGAEQSQESGGSGQPEEGQEQNTPGAGSGERSEDPQQQPGGGPGEIPDELSKEDIQRLRETIEQLDQDRARSEEERKRAEDLRRQSREMYENLSDEEKQRIQRLAQQLQDELGEDSPEGVGGERDPLPGTPGSGEPFKDPELVDARPDGDPESMNDGHVIEEKLNPDGTPPERGEVSEREMAQLLEEAREKAAESAEERQIPAKYRRILDEYYRKSSERAREAAEETADAPARTAPDSDPDG